MLRFYKFRDELFAPRPARDVYVKRPSGRGWPEECPPIRAANAFGFDLLANFDVAFLRNDDGTWRAEPDIEIGSDFDWSGDEDSPGRPLVQRYAWFWERQQQIPHVISDDVFEAIRNQVKVSTFLFLASDPNEVLLIGEVPNSGVEERGWRAMSALVETDWYPASYPWHVVLELDERRERVEVSRGQPLARIVPVRRDTYFAGAMTTEEFDAFFARGQRWLAAHGRPHSGEAGGPAGVAGATAAGKATPSGDGNGEAVGDAGVLDITRTYVRQQARSRFIVLD